MDMAWCLVLCRWKGGLVLRHAHRIVQDTDLGMGGSLAGSRECHQPDRAKAVRHAGLRLSADVAIVQARKRLGFVGESLRLARRRDSQKLRHWRPFLPPMVGPHRRNIWAFAWHGRAAIVLVLLVSVRYAACHPNTLQRAGAPGGKQAELDNYQPYRRRCTSFPLDCPRAYDACLRAPSLGPRFKCGRFWLDVAVPERRSGT